MNVEFLDPPKSELVEANPSISSTTIIARAKVSATDLLQKSGGRLNE